MLNGKTPNVEKSLSIWAKNQQNKGSHIDESRIIAQAQHFASACGCPGVAEKFKTQEWLENFKSKNLSGTKPNEPLCSESQNTSYAPTTTNCLPMDGISPQRLAVRPYVAVENGAGYSMSPIETDEGKNTTGANSQVSKAIKVKHDQEVVSAFSQCWTSGFDDDESDFIDKWEGVLEARDSDLDIPMSSDAH
jgi:hypothetical protein